MKRIYLITVSLLIFFGRVDAQEISDLKMSVNRGSVEMETEDEKFSFGIGGRAYLDAATYFDDESDLGNGSEVRDVRFSMKATLWAKWNAKINISFADESVALKDVFLQYNINKNSLFRVGNFFEPFGVEQTESSKTIKFMHLSSTIEAFRPNRNLGMSYAVWDNKYFWEMGLFGSDTENTSEGDEGYGLTSRLTFAPIQREEKLLHFGLSGTYRTANANGFDEEGNENSKTIRYRSRAATHIERRRFIDTQNIDEADHQVKFGFEMIAATGPLSLQGEYISAKVSRESDMEDYNANGYYAQMGYLLKGGNYQYKSNTARLSKPAPGSLELLLRYNHTDLNDSSSAIMGGEQKDITLGCTWYMNHNILIKLNFTNVDLDKYALNGEENFNMIQSRLQFSF
ncbi:OprO/OprP family phosphate-selective porin [Labilibaculum sp.]|uniref:OprO/OprP family phosphate-selective porin n=1 Tax=Labilibaculum sp. TaxID=2060723 RepID=UPI003565551B